MLPIYLTQGLWISAFSRQAGLGNAPRGRLGETGPGAAGGVCLRRAV
jgi:hypothetical protein